MCFAHWSLVSDRLRRRISAGYLHFTRTSAFAEDYLDAVQDAVTQVQAREAARAVQG